MIVVNHVQIEGYDTEGRDQQDSRRARMKTPALYQAQELHGEERHEQVDGVDVRQQCGEAN